MTRLKSQSLKVDTPETLPPLFLYSRVGPKFPDGAVFTPPEENDMVYEASLKEYRMWFLAWIIHSCQPPKKIFRDRKPHPLDHLCVINVLSYLSIILLLKFATSAILP